MVIVITAFSKKSRKLLITAQNCISAVNSKRVRFLKLLVSEGDCDDVSRKLTCIFISFTSTHMTWMKEKYCVHS